VTDTATEPQLVETLTLPITTPNQLSHTIHNMTNGHPYTISVTCTNEYGTSEPATTTVTPKSASTEVKKIIVKSAHQRTEFSPMSGGVVELPRDAEEATIFVVTADNETSVLHMRDGDFEEVSDGFGVKLNPGRHRFHFRTQAPNGVNVDDFGFDIVVSSSKKTTKNIKKTTPSYIWVIVIICIILFLIGLALFAFLIYRKREKQQGRDRKETEQMIPPAIPDDLELGGMFTKTGPVVKIDVDQMPNRGRGSTCYQPLTTEHGVVNGGKKFGRLC